MFRGIRRAAGSIIISESVLGVLSKALSYLGGLLAAVFAGLFLTLSEQGFFFTFLSFASLTVLIELGLNTVIIQFISHERAFVSATADEASKASAESRMASVGRFAFCWFAVGAAVFAFLVTPLGLVFFHSEANPDTTITGPWLMLAMLIAVDIMLFPAWSILEGVGEVRAIYAYRSARALAMGLGMIAFLAAGMKLWALAAGFAATLPLSAFVLYRYRGRFTLFLQPPKGARVVWVREMLPLQWKLALSWLAGYVSNWALTPVTLKLLGSEAAGQVGMTWALGSGIGAIASAVVMVKAPLFGALVATRQFSELDRIALRQGLVSIALALIGAGTALGLVQSLSAFGHPFAERFLPAGPMSMVLLAVVLMQITFPMSVYLRAHKREPYLFLSLGYAACVIAAAALLGNAYGVAGIAAGYLAAAALLVLPIGTLIFLRCRSEWHRDLL